MVQFPRDNLPVAIWRSKRLRIAIRILQEITKVEGLSPTDKVVYYTVMLQQPRSIDALADTMRMHRRTIVDRCSDLERLGWMQFTKDGFRQRPCAVVPLDVETILATETREEMRLAPFLGEETSKRYVDWFAAPSVRLVFNVRPAFLGNRKKEKDLELDIFAPDYAWGLEHQGYQHFGPSSEYYSAEEFVEQHKRDLRKAYLCKKNNVRLSAVSVLDLTFQGMQAAIPLDIPRRTFDPKGPYVQMLESVGRQLAGPQGPEG